MGKHAAFFFWLRQNLFVHLNLVQNLEKMKKQFWILWAFALLLTACQKDAPLDPVLPENPTSPTDGGGGEPDEDGGLTLYRVTENSIDKIKDYPVGPDLKPYQLDYAKHLKMWDFFTGMLPLEERDKIAEFEVFHGGGELLGYVTPVDENDLGRWRFALAIDAAEELEKVDFNDLFTLVTLHEYGHVLSLNDEQVEVGGSPESCGNYFPGEGCSLPNSYINRLVELGWADILDELDEGNPYAIYDSYPDRFVSDYAATNPGEDMAEVFAFFVAKDAPSGNTIADQKIKMLYDFPELVELRSAIRQKSEALGIRPNGWVTNPKVGQFRVCGRKGCRHGKRPEGSVN